MAWRHRQNSVISKKPRYNPEVPNQKPPSPQLNIMNRFKYERSEIKRSTGCENNTKEASITWCIELRVNAETSALWFCDAHFISEILHLCRKGSAPSVIFEWPQVAQRQTGLCSYYAKLFYERALNWLKFTLIGSLWLAFLLTEIKICLTAGKKLLTLQHETTSRSQSILLVFLWQDIKVAYTTLVIYLLLEVVVIVVVVEG